MITQERLKELFDYQDGNLIRKVNRGRGVNSVRWKAGTKLGCQTTGGYFRASVDYKNYKLHRLIWLWHYGSFPKYHIDHIDENPSNNRIENLREATDSQNTQNKSKAQRDNKLDMLGVHKVNNKYRSAIWVNKQRIHLGYFETPENAHKAYMEAKAKYHPFWVNKHDI